MGLPLGFSSFFLSLLLLFPALCTSQDTFVYSRATYFGSPDCLGNPKGACGYGDYGRTVNDGNVGATSKLWKSGAGCGACYQVRCKIPQKCTDEGVNIVVTDHGASDNADFILSPRAFTKMARPNVALDLLAYGEVDIEYKRIPCQYPGYNLMVKVHEHSKFPEYLAIVFIYQAGLYDIVAVEIWQEDCQEWRPMRRAFGTVWDTPNPPRGMLTVRSQLTGGADGPKWLQTNNVVPSEWKAGVAYDTSVQLT
ncbi:expansin-like B1 [Macadamia integrifolia]|uniref:expansin-like B1 n=1 Tax=Macadamia integrifolia TaxID=60698 RepID=UPI001C4EF53E|nr:expansin-like B1 [Macadamia integrifolia]